MPGKTRTKDLDAAIDSMPESHLHCRDYGHSWSPFTARKLAGARGGYEQHLRCSRCHTTRKRLLDRNGEIVSGGYDYADGYLVAGLGRLTGSDRGHIRVASVMATLTFDEGEVASA